MFLSTARLRHWLERADRAVDELLAGDWAEWEEVSALIAHGDADGTTTPRARLNPASWLAEPMPVRFGGSGGVSATAVSGGPPSPAVLGNPLAPLQPPGTFAGTWRTATYGHIGLTAARARRRTGRDLGRRAVHRRAGAVAPLPARCLSPVPVRGRGRGR